MVGDSPGCPKKGDRMAYPIQLGGQVASAPRAGVTGAFNRSWLRAVGGALAAACGVLLGVSWDQLRER